MPRRFPERGSWDQPLDLSAESSYGSPPPQPRPYRRPFQTARDAQPTHSLLSAMFKTSPKTDSGSTSDPVIWVSEKAVAKPDKKSLQQPRTPPRSLDTKRRKFKLGSFGSKSQQPVKTPPVGNPTSTFGGSLSDDEDDLYTASPIQSPKPKPANPVAFGPFSQPAHVNASSTSGSSGHPNHVVQGAQMEWEFRAPEGANKQSWARKAAAKLKVHRDVPHPDIPGARVDKLQAELIADLNAHVNEKGLGLTEHGKTFGKMVLPDS